VSDKINQKLADNTTQFPLSNAEFAYINSLDTVGRSFEHYISQLKRDYLHTLALNNGYKSEDNLELSIDLKDESRILTVNKLPS
jgi:hypothetical protein